jgi:hypothetical protein
MTDEELDYDLKDLKAGPMAWHWRLKAAAVCAVLGAIYGAGVGSTIGTAAGAGSVIGAAAGIVALLLGLYGARFSLFLGPLNRVRYGRLVFVSWAAITGAILGGYLGLVAVTPFGVVILGSVAGWIVTRAILRRFVLRRLLGGFVGIVLGVCLGAVIVALEKDQSAALVGVAFGVGIGAVIGPLLFLLFMESPRVLLPLLPRWRRANRNSIDASFQGDDQRG